MKLKLAVSSKQEVLFWDLVGSMGFREADICD
jgi:hypothetical protein